MRNPKDGLSGSKGIGGDCIALKPTVMGANLA